MERSDLQVVPATEELVQSMEGRLRVRDVLECYAAAELDGKEGLWQSVKASEHCWVAIWKGKATVSFGVCTMDGVIGVPWALGTDDITDMGYVFLLESPKYIEKIREPYALLLNWVDARNDVSIKWLLRMGFTVGAPRPYGPFGQKFHPFWMRGGTTGFCGKCRGDKSCA